MKINSLEKIHKGWDRRVLDSLNHITIIQREQITRGACGILLILLKEKGECSFSLKAEGWTKLLYIHCQDSIYSFNLKKQN